MNKRENKILIKVAEDVATLKANHQENFNNIKDIKELLIIQNGRISKAEQGAIKNSAKLSGLQWLIRGLIACILAVAGWFLKSAFQ